MTDKKQSPLDYDEVRPTLVENPPSKLQRWLQNLELVPLLILAVGLWMKYRGVNYSSELLIVGGTTSAFLYLGFSWVMFRVGKYFPLEIVLSILCGLAFATGIIAVLFRLESWEMSRDILNFGLWGVLGLLLVSMGLFVLHLKDKRASLFYRNLIARLLIFAVLLLYFSRVYF